MSGSDRVHRFDRKGNGLPDWREFHRRRNGFFQATKGHHCGNEALTRHYLVDVLNDLGYQVVEFDNAEQAAAFCSQSCEDIYALLTDFTLPGVMNGLELAKYFLAIRPQMVVVLISGGFRRAPVGLHKAARFLPKPVTPADLLEALA